MFKRFFALLLPIVAVLRFRRGRAGFRRPTTEWSASRRCPSPGRVFPKESPPTRRGRIYVATFDFNQPNVIYIFDRNGQAATRRFRCPGVLPLGLEFDARRATCTSRISVTAMS